MAAKTAAEIEDKLFKRYHSDMINMSQVGKFMGFKNSETTKNFLDGISYCSTDRMKLYFIEDVAKRISYSMVSV